MKKEHVIIVALIVALLTTLLLTNIQYEKNNKIIQDQQKEINELEKQVDEDENIIDSLNEQFGVYPQ